MDILNDDLWSKVQMFLAIVVTGFVFYWVFSLRLKVKNDAVRTEVNQGFERVNAALEMLKQEPGPLPSSMGRKPQEFSRPVVADEGAGKPSPSRAVAGRSSQGRCSGAPRGYPGGRSAAEAANEGPAGDAYRQVAILAGQGLTASQIAEQIGVPRGEIRMILAFEGGNAMIPSRPQRELRLY